MKKNLLFISTVLAFTFPLRSFAGSCEGYPEMDGVRTEVTEDGSFRTFSTVTVPVPIDRSAVVVQAKKRGQIIAKGQIVSFMEDDVSNACKDDDLNKQKNILSTTGEGESENYDFDTSIETLCSVTIRARDFVRGARKIGECYTPGQEVKITLGVSPKTTSAAQSLKQMMSKPQTGTSSPSYSPAGAKPGGVGGFSRFETDF